MLARRQVVVQDELPLAYLPGGVTRVVIKVVGDLAESADRPGLGAASTRNGAPEVIWDTRLGDAGASYSVRKRHQHWDHS